MARRKIEGLKWAKRADRPRFIPTVECKNPTTRAGHLYEERFADYLRARVGRERVLHGQWFAYEDGHGPGWAQTDVLLLPLTPTEPLIVFECKLTQTKRAAEQKLKNVYLPLVGHVWPDHRLKPVQVCHNLHFGADLNKVLTKLDTLLLPDVELGFACLRWRPR